MLRIPVKAILLSVPHIDLSLRTITTCRDGASCQIAVNLKVSPSLLYARVLLDKSSVELFSESVQEEL